MGMFSMIDKSVKLVAALALVLAPSVWGQGDGAVKKILDKAKETKTEGAKHADAVDAVQVDGTGKPKTTKPAPSTPAPAKSAPSSKSAPASDAEKKGTAPQAPPAKPAPKRVSPPLNDNGDPFALPIKPPSVSVSPQNLPPGQAGLLVSQAEVQGMLKMPGGNRVIIRGPGNPPRVYFLKVGDKIYNAHITRITDDAVYFEETVVDPMGKTQKREVAKRMPSEGKQ